MDNINTRVRLKHGFVFLVCIEHSPEVHGAAYVGKCCIVSDVFLL